MSTSDLTKDGMQRAKARGVRIGGIPFGETEDERAIIAAAVELRASGRTLEQVSADLAARGMFSRRGVPLSVSTLFEILRRAGQHKQHKQPKQPKQPKQHKQLKQLKQLGHAVQTRPAFSREALRAGSIDRSKLRISG